MTCSDFVAHFSEYFDGTAPEKDLHQAEEHLSGCPACRRYTQVVRRGAELLRALPVPEIAEDFAPRLQHRLYHVDAEATLGRPTSSVAPSLTVLGMAVLLAAVAWAPTLRPSAPEVELPAIEVSNPPAFPRYRTTSLYSLDVNRDSYGLGDVPHSVRPIDLWNDPPGVLFQYSIMSQRYRRSFRRRTGVEEDR